MDDHFLVLCDYEFQLEDYKKIVSSFENMEVPIYSATTYYYTFAGFHSLQPGFMAMVRLVGSIT